MSSGISAAELQRRHLLQQQGYTLSTSTPVPASAVGAPASGPAPMADPFPSLGGANDDDPIVQSNTNWGPNAAGAIGSPFPAPGSSSSTAPGPPTAIGSGAGADVSAAAVAAAGAALGDAPVNGAAANGQQVGQQRNGYAGTKQQQQPDL